LALDTAAAAESLEERAFLEAERAGDCFFDIF
jgi:hypothetical protein